MRKKIYLTTLAAFLMVAGVAAESDEDLIITPQGYGAFEFGQIGHGYYRAGSAQINTEISHITQQRSFANLGLTARYNDNLEIELIGEGMMAFSYPQVGKEPTTMQPRNFYYIKSSNAKIMFGDPAMLSGIFQVGYFPYKYNSEVRNLGEYLFRTIPYPLVVFADFDYPQATLLGMRLNTSATLFDQFVSNDLLLHSETVTHPVQNWSLSDVAELRLVNMFTLGGGISLYHWFSAYQGKNIDGSVDSKYYLSQYTDSQRIELGLDSIKYEAVKLMGRLSIDLKQIFNYAPILPIELFGPADLKIYGEVNILGLQDYPGVYDNLKDRTIWSFGINLPGFNFIDTINYEFEYCENGTAFSDSRFFAADPSLRPDPIGSDPNSVNSDPLTRSKTRWSVYVRKSFFNEHFSIIGQIARDHKKLNFYYFDISHMSFSEVLPTKKDWWWVLKTEYKF